MVGILSSTSFALTQPPPTLKLLNPEVWHQKPFIITHGGAFLKKEIVFWLPSLFSEMWQRAPSFKKTEDVHFFLGVKTFYMFYTQITIWIGKKMQLKLTLCKKPHLFHSSALPNWLYVWVCNPLTKAFSSLHSFFNQLSSNDYKPESDKWWSNKRE